MKKTHKVILLNTEAISNIGIPLGDLQYDKDGFDPHVVQCKHLYIISDDEIKEGDWMYNTHHNIISKGPGGGNHYDKKIVATTDESIGYTDHRISPVPNFCDYPQLPESFIQAYIKAYNEGKSITEVDLEMDKTFHGYFDEGGEDWRYSAVKTRPDNTVIVHQSKMYSKKEVEKLCEKAFRAGREAQNNLNGNKCPSAWIQDNLK